MFSYKGYIIKEYFANFFLHHSDVTIDAAENKIIYHQSTVEPWRISLIDTGADSMTGGRLRRARPYLHPTDPFCFTYGDGVSDVDIASSSPFMSNRQPCHADGGGSSRSIWRA